jgi:hypothetical protein
MKNNFYMNKANFLLEKIEEDSSKQIIALDMWSWNFERGPYTIYTVTDGEGNYPLSNDGAVFFTEYEDSVTNLEIDGKPHSTGKELFVFAKENSFGVYDENFVLKYGPFRNEKEALDEINDLIENGDIQTHNDEIYDSRR